MQRTVWRVRKTIARYVRATTLSELKTRLLLDLYEFANLYSKGYQNASDWVGHKLGGNKSLLVALYETPRLDYKPLENYSLVSQQFVSWLEQFSCALEGYTWLISNRIISVDTFLANRQSILFDCMKYFVGRRSLESIEGMNLDTSEVDVLTPTERNTLLRKKGFVIDRIMTFTKTLLDMQSDSVDVSFLSHMFFKLFGYCLFQPDVLGLESMHTGEADNKLAIRLEALLKHLHRSVGHDIAPVMGKALGDVAFMADVDLLAVEHTSGTNIQIGL